MRDNLPEGTISLGKAPCGCERVQLPMRPNSFACLHDENCAEKAEPVAEPVKRTTKKAAK